MKYYKLINGTNFVGIGTTNDLRQFQPKHKIILACDESKAQYIQFEDVLYHASWMLPANIDCMQYIVSEVIAIDEDEYNLLKESYESGEDIQISQEDPPTEEPPPPPTDADTQVTINYLKTQKILAMNFECEKSIISGFDIMLSDGQSHHFSLDISDQVMISKLNDKAISGETVLPWHADGEECKFYNPQDIMAINASMENLITYHTTYCNSLKMYISALDDMDTISSIQYGSKIPVEYQSEVYKSIIGIEVS